MKYTVDRLRELCAKATAGPWEVETPQGRDTQWLDIVVGPNGDEILHAEAQMLSCHVHPDHQADNDRRISQHISNLEFTAASRTALPALLDEVAICLELRRRIHMAEKHNQMFERCESAWCRPSADNDPAREAAKGRESKSDAVPLPPGEA